MLAPKKTWILLASVLLAACNTPPTSIVQQPLTARPTPPTEVRPSNGAIFQVATTRPLFEDRVPRYVGDTMTVVIEEKTSTQNKEETSLSRESSYNAGTPTVNLPLFPGVIEKKLGGVNVSAGASGSSEERSSPPRRANPSTKVASASANATRLRSSCEMSPATRLAKTPAHGKPAR